MIVSSGTKTATAHRVIAARPPAHRGSRAALEQSSARHNLINVVTRMFVWPASIFWSVRTLRSAASANLSCVIPRAIRSRLRFPPKTLSC